MKLHFPHAELARLLAIARKQWELEVQTLYGEQTGPGFWLVGDHGVYLMQNGKGINGAKSQPIVYADECNPDTLPFDEWWANKNASFGGDDGAEFIDADIIIQAVGRGDDVVIELSHKHMAIYTCKGVTVQ
jgi:Protein of unknown function (DUF3085)